MVVRTLEENAARGVTYIQKRVVFRLAAFKAGVYARANAAKECLRSNKNSLRLYLSSTKTPGNYSTLEATIISILRSISTLSHAWGYHQRHPYSVIWTTPLCRWY